MAGLLLAAGYLYCTPRFPALVQRGEDGSWQAARIDLVGTAGAMESAATLYAAVCHPGENWQEEGFVARHGYRGSRTGISTCPSASLTTS